MGAILDSTVATAFLLEERFIKNKNLSLSSYNFHQFSFSLVVGSFGVNLCSDTMCSSLDERSSTLFSDKLQIRFRQHASQSDHSTAGVSITCVVDKHSKCNEGHTFQFPSAFSNTHLRCIYTGMGTFILASGQQIVNHSSLINERKDQKVLPITILELRTIRLALK